MALEFIIRPQSALNQIFAIESIVTPVKVPILGANGIEATTEFNSFPLQSMGSVPFTLKGGPDLCTFNRMQKNFPIPYCVYGWIYFIPKYVKEDPDCDDRSNATHKIFLSISGSDF